MTLPGIRGIVASAPGLVQTMRRHFRAPEWRAQAAGAACARAACDRRGLRAMPVDRMLVARVLVLAAGLGLAGCKTTNPTTVYPLLSYTDTEQRLLHAPDVIPAPDID